jgi:WD40 repeat protein
MERAIACDRYAQVSWWWLRRIITGALLLTGALALSGCEDDPGAPPRPGAVSQMATAVADPPDDEASAEFEGLGDFEFPSAPLPPADYMYFSYGRDVWQLSVSGEPEQVTDDLAVHGFSSNAQGDRLAVLSSGNEGPGNDEISVTVIDAQGSEVFELSDLVEDGIATTLQSIDSVSMSPSGDRFATTQTDGGMSLITLDGELQSLLQPSIDHRPWRLAWSSDGQFLAYLDPWMTGSPSSLVVHVPARDIRQPLVRPGSDDHGVIRARWVPGTPYIVMVRESGSTIPGGGDLFLVDAETGRQELIMSSGAIAPVAGVVDIASSPDGTWLAATGYVPGEDHPGFAGLWLINFNSGLQSEIEINSGEHVTDLWWLGEALIVRTISEPQTSLPGTYTGRESFRLLEIDPESGDVSERYASD